MIGRTVGKYRIVGQLGRGATGIVYKAVDDTLGREVAIKVINPDLANADIVKRFRAEATTLARLNHPEIATIYEFCPSETDLLMVMELVRGETLEKLSDRVGQMPTELAAHIIDRILSALEHAHRAGIVHRDMKPANVMVTEGGAVKIMDFGIARVRGAEHLTIDGLMIGTPAYMAPEQGLGEEVDERTDLYSVGVMFYRLLTATLPFKADTPIAMLHKQVLDTPTPLHVHRAGLPPWCDTVIRRALAKLPADRFQTAEEFRDALHRATGMRTADPAKAFNLAQSDVVARPEYDPASTPATLRTETILPAASAASVIGSPNASPQARSSVGVRGLAGYWSSAARFIALHKKSFTQAGPLVAVVAIAAVLAFAALRRPADLIRAATAPPLTFETKVLVGTGSRQREPVAQLLLADGTITVIADGNTQRPLHAVPYGAVVSISYTRGPDPMWNSPKGPALAARVRGGVLGKLGIYPERHWISLRTDDDRFIILRVDDALVRNVLTALEERTGCTMERIP
jgi:serine/threonine-protein kinase